MAIPTLGSVIRGHARRDPDHPAIEFQDQVTSYGALDRQSNRLANGLAVLGLKPGDRVAFLGKNSDAYFILFFGAAKAGIVTAPVNWRLAPPEVAYIVAESTARILIIDEEFEPALASYRAELRHVETIIVIGTPRDEAHLDFRQWLGRQSDAAPSFHETPDQIVIQLYTSGTTGRPKGAMLTNRNFVSRRLACAAAGIDWDRSTPDDIILVAMPVAHIGGTGSAFLTFYGGAKAVVMREFEPSRALDIIERARITLTFMVPAALRVMVQHSRARQIDYRALRYVLYGASPIPLDLLRECVEVFGCKFAQMYGMTETTGTIVALDAADHDPQGSPRMRSAGKPLPGVEVRVVALDGKDAPVGEVGEIVTRSSSNMAGYWNLPDATARTIDAEGWLRTGDAGYLDADGYLYLYDRVKDMIVSGAENVYPAEVESAVYGHPDVADVCVIGVPDEQWGEAVRAIVVLKPGATPDPDAIIAWTRQRIAGFKTPKAIDFAESLPRNASGKLLRRLLREPYWAGKDRRVN
jgi:long-chain acyl-CoA synthetase